MLNHHKTRWELKKEFEYKTWIAIKAKAIGNNRKTLNYTKSEKYPALQQNKAIQRHHSNFICNLPPTIKANYIETSLFGSSYCQPHAISLLCLGADQKIQQNTANQDTNS